MIDKKFNIKSILKIILDTIFYSYSILIMFLMFTNIPITKEQIYTSIFPVGGVQFWFVTDYLMLYILVPILNKIFNLLDKKQIEFYLLIFLIFQFLIPVFTYKIHFGGSNFFYMIIIYFIGAYIKRYGLSFFEYSKNQILTIIVSACFVYGWMLICLFLNIQSRIWFNHLSVLGSIFTVLVSVSVFYFFKNIKISYAPWINFFASSAFSVYLITEHPIIQKKIWIYILYSTSNISTEFILWNSLFTVITVYFICTIIDKIKNKTVDKYIFNKIIKKEYIKKSGEKFNL